MYLQTVDGQVYYGTFKSHGNVLEFCHRECVGTLRSAHSLGLSKLSRWSNLHRLFSSLMFQVNLEYLESKLESVDGEEVQRIQDNINSLFHHCVQALGEEHQIKVVNALQVTKAQEDRFSQTVPVRSI